jgi:inorganic pyrophosphatase
MTKGLLTIAHQLETEALTCRAIVETPQGQRCKFDYDSQTGLFELAGVLSAGLAFPLAFGFIPSTRGEDGDPLDVLLLADDALPVGCLVSVRLIGVIEAEQTEQDETCRNDRLIARIAESKTYADICEIAQMGPAFVDQLASFFRTYNALKGGEFKVIGIGDAAEAVRLISAGVSKTDDAG